MANTLVTDIPGGLGLDYPLNANTDHVFTINNTGTGSATVFWWITFSEG